MNSLYTRFCHTHMLKGLLALLLLGGLTGVANSGELRDISYSALPGERVEILLKFSAPVPSPRTFTTNSPARIAIDLPGVTSALSAKARNIGIGVARSIAAIQASDRTRVVINLIEAAPFKLTSQGNQLRVSIASSGVAPTVTKGAATHASGSKSASAVSRQRVRIEKVDFRRGKGGEGRVELTLSSSRIIADMREQGNTVLVDIKDADLPPALAQTLDVTDFATPVLAVLTKPQGGGVRVEMRAQGDFDHVAYQSGNLYVIEFRSLTKREKEQLKKEQRVYVGQRLSLNFQDIEVRAVLQLLADFTGLNMVVSDTVGGRITLRLKNVPWDHAMDIILKTKGLSMRRTDNVILIAPTEEIAAREKLELESKKQIRELAPLRSEVIQINYAKAIAVAELLTDEKNKLISKRGSVTVDERTNTLLVLETDAKLQEIRALVVLLDVPVRQVLIESRIVIANDDFAKDLGVKLGFGTGFGVGGKGDQVVVGGGLPGGLAGTSDVYIGNFGQTIDDPTTGFSNNIVSGGAQALLVNLPQTLAAGSGGALNLLVGRVGAYLLQLELSAMQQEGKGKIVSSPRVITSDQNKAIIKQGIEIPYQEASSSGATSVNFKEAVLKLEVTPHITPDDRVIMDLKINKDDPDFSRSVLGVPPLETRRLETSVLVSNGETIVLGGIFEQSQSTTQAKVPFFGDLPGVGVLFRQTQEQDSNSELLIFVTPKILKDTLAVR